MKGMIELLLDHGDEDVSVIYGVKINALEADINNAAPWIDEKASDSLRRTFEKSMNKRKKEILLPLWLPYDADVSLSFK